MALNCDCGSDQVRVEISVVRPHGQRAVFVCDACGLAWINTEPGVIEQLIVARASSSD